LLASPTGFAGDIKRKKQDGNASGWRMKRERGYAHRLKPTISLNLINKEDIMGLTII